MTQFWPTGNRKTIAPEYLKLLPFGMSCETSAGVANGLEAGATAMVTSAMEIGGVKVPAISLTT